MQWFELRSEVGVGDEGMALKFFDGALKEGTSGSETGEGSRRTREGDGGRVARNLNRDAGECSDGESGRMEEVVCGG